MDLSLAEKFLDTLPLCSGFAPFSVLRAGTNGNQRLVKAHGPNSSRTGSVDFLGGTVKKLLLSLLWLIAAGGFVYFAAPCIAEDPMYDQPVITLSGGIISPAAPQERIRMDLMQVNIRMQTGSYILDAVFHLFNTGETTTEWVGFPKHGKAAFQLSGQIPLIRDFIQFNAWVDGREEYFEEKRSFLHGSSYPFPGPRLAGRSEETKWMAKKITFSKNTMTTIRVRLEAYMDDRIYSLHADIGYFFFGPGKYWKNKIGKAEIVLMNPDRDNKNRWMRFDHLGTTTMKRTVTKMEERVKLRELDVGANGCMEFGSRCLPDKKEIEK